MAKVIFKRSTEGATIAIAEAGLMQQPGEYICYTPAVLSVVVLWPFFRQILPQLKNIFEKSKCAHNPHTRCHLCAKFDVLRPF